MTFDTFIERISFSVACVLALCLPFLPIFSSDALLPAFVGTFAMCFAASLFLATITDGRIRKVFAALRPEMSLLGNGSTTHWFDPELGWLGSRWGGRLYGYLRIALLLELLVANAVFGLDSWLSFAFYAAFAIVILVSIRHSLAPS